MRQNIFFKFGIVLVTIIILSIVELFFHISTIASLKQATNSLARVQTSIENLLEADRDAYQLNLALISSIHLIIADKNSDIDSFSLAAKENLDQIGVRFDKFVNNYNFEKSNDLIKWTEISSKNYVLLKTLIDSIFNDLYAGQPEKAFIIYKTKFSQSFYQMRNGFDKITEIHNSETEKYFYQINSFNNKLKNRAYSIYALMVIIFLLVAYLSIKSIHKKTKKIEKLTEELEYKNEELNKANKDLNQVNEELEFSNEELVTSNEELYTLNDSLAEQKTKLEESLDQLRTAQLQLIQSEKNAAIGIMVAGFAHEINNPVNFVASGVSSLEKNKNQLFHLLKLYSECNDLESLKKLQTKASEYLNDTAIDKLKKIYDGIAEGSKRICDLVEKIRLHHNGNELIEVSDINKIVDFCIGLVLHTPNKDIAFEKKYGQVPVFKCNFSTLCQIIDIITKNAIDSINKTGSISYITGSNDEDIYISISDSGCGIPNQIKDKIFDPFFTTKQVGKGTGLGLFLASEKIKKMNGRIIVDSEPGKGSTFTIFIPKNMDVSNSANFTHNNYTI